MVSRKESILLVAVLLVSVAKYTYSVAVAPHPPQQGTNATTATHNTTSVANVTSTVTTRDNNTSTEKNSSVPLPLAGDLYKGGFSQSHSELCPAAGAKLQLVVLVASAPAHTEARKAVRLTWGHISARRDVAMAFVLGNPPPEYNAALAEEDALYGDIILGNFQDSYSNLTLKTLAMFEWKAAHCASAPRLLKTDDDVFLNVPLLLSFVEKHSNDTRTIWGRVEKKSIPKRSPDSKYYVSQKEFSGRMFPPFTTGPAYLLTADSIAPLLANALKTTYLKLEDVFMTGIVAEKLGIQRVHAPEFYNRKITPKPCTIKRTISAHMVKYHQQFEFWQKLLDGKSKCK